MENMPPTTADRLHWLDRILGHYAITGLQAYIEVTKLGDADPIERLKDVHLYVSLAFAERGLQVGENEREWLKRVVDEYISEAEELDDTFTADDAALLTDLLLNAKEIVLVPTSPCISSLNT